MLRTRKFVFITEHHCVPQKLPTQLRAHRFHHQCLGGGTTFSGVYCTNPDIKPLQPSPNQRVIGDFLDHGIRPSCRVTNTYVNYQQPLPVQHINLLVRYPTSFCGSGVGFWPLTVEELSACFGYPKYTRFKFLVSSFPILPADIGNQLLRHYSTFGNIERIENQPALSPIPMPKEFVFDPRGTFLPYMNTFMPHQWWNQSTTTVDAPETRMSSRSRTVR